MGGAAVEIALKLAQSEGLFGVREMFLLRMGFYSKDIFFFIYTILKPKRNFVEPLGND